MLARTHIHVMRGLRLLATQPPRGLQSHRDYHDASHEPHAPRARDTVVREMCDVHGHVHMAGSRGVLAYLEALWRQYALLQARLDFEPNVLPPISPDLASPWRQV